MNKYFIEINENDFGYYDFVIRLLNEETMEEPYNLGTRDNVEDLGECYRMIEEFPLSPTSVLSTVTLNRLNPYRKPNMLEVLFVISMNSLIDNKVKNIEKFILN